MQCHGFGELDVGGVVAGGAINDGVFAGIGNDLELLRLVSTDRAGVGGHGAVGQAQPIEHSAVRLGHVFVAQAAGFDVAIKGVGVLHGELAPTHHTKTRPAFIAELGLDVIKILRQLAVAAQLLARDVGHDLFAGGLDHEVAVVAIFHTQQLGPVFLKAPGFTPQLGGLHHRHQELDRTGAVHLFADDGFDLADHAQAQRHVVVDARTKALDEAGTQHQLMAGDLGVGGRFLERGDKGLAGFHGVPGQGTEGARRPGQTKAANGTGDAGKRGLTARTLPVQ